MCHVDVDHGVGPAAEVYRHEAQRLVHRHVAVRRADDAGAVAQRPIQRLAQADRHILDGVVRVHMQIAVRLHGQIEQPVVGEEGQHVVKKPDAGAHVRHPPAVERQGQVDIGFAGFAVDGCGTHERPRWNYELRITNCELFFGWRR